MMKRTIQSAQKFFRSVPVSSFKLHESVPEGTKRFHLPVTDRFSFMPRAPEGSMSCMRSLKKVRFHLPAGRRVAERTCPPSRKS